MSSSSSIHPVPLANKLQTKKKTLTEASEIAQTQQTQAQQRQREVREELERRRKQREEQEEKKRIASSNDIFAKNDIDPQGKALFMLRELEVEYEGLNRVHSEITDQMSKLQIEEKILQRQLQFYENMLRQQQQQQTTSHLGDGVGESVIHVDSSNVRAQNSVRLDASLNDFVQRITNGSAIVSGSSSSGSSSSSGIMMDSMSSLNHAAVAASSSLSSLPGSVVLDVDEIQRGMSGSQSDDYHHFNMYDHEGDQYGLSSGTEVFGAPAVHLYGTMIDGTSYDTDPALVSTMPSAACSSTNDLICSSAENQVVITNQRSDNHENDYGEEYDGEEAAMDDNGEEDGMGEYLDEDDEDEDMDDVERLQSVLQGR